MKTLKSMLVFAVCMLGACTHSDDEDARGDDSASQTDGDGEETPVAEIGPPKESVEGVKPPKPVDDVTVPTAFLPEEPAMEDPVVFNFPDIPDDDDVAPTDDDTVEDDDVAPIDDDDNDVAPTDDDIVEDDDTVPTDDDVIPTDDDDVAPGDDDTVCVPDCTGRECGPDPVCGVSCGGCEDGEICTADSCAPNGQCTHNPDLVACPPPVEECQTDADCADGNKCNGDEKCSAAHTCSAGTALDCDDGLFCNGTESCDTKLGCRPGVAPDCTFLNGQCAVGKCDEASDACVNDTAVKAGAACGSASENQCDGRDTCDGAGVCQANFKASGTTCEDGQYCTVGETCNGFGSCGGSSARDCSSFANQCNDGVCDEAADTCKAQAARESQSCNDGSSCTVNETCQSGSCTGGSSLDADGDTYVSQACGGTDCNDGDASIHPGATDSVGNGVDDNCDGIDGVDIDNDDYASVASGGNDCDDSNATINPGRTDDPIEVTVEEDDRQIDPNIGDANGNGADIAVDTDGVVYIAYDCDWQASGFRCIPSDPNILYAVRHVSSKDWNSGYTWEGGGAKVEVDSQKRPWVVYVPKSEDCVHYWIDPADGTGNDHATVCSPSISSISAVLDSTDTLRFAYYDGFTNSGSLVYAEQEPVSGTWQSTIVDGQDPQDDDAGNGPLLAIDATGQPQIASTLSTGCCSPEVRYSSREAGGLWTTVTLANNSVVGGFGVDGSGTFHLLTGDILTGIAHYFQKNFGPWTEQVFPGQTVSFPFFVTGDGSVYARDIAAAVRTNFSGTWEGIGVGPAGGIRALAVANGYIHFVYTVYESDHYSLHYARHGVTNAVDENCDGK